VLHKLVRRPLFSAGAALAVLGATGAAYLATGDQLGPDVAQAAYSVPAQPLTSEQVAAADAQSSADAADAAAIDALEERAAAADEARALAAEQAAAAERAEAARQAAAEKASRDALRAAIEDPRGAARVLVSERGWSSEQFSCLDSLWTKESNWRVDADNPSSSAYGIPQALPGSKMASAGADWETNPVTQITWGLEYIADSYGTPCAAWSHSRSHNWY
jgi:hypothetical protein